jgi:putative tricarboxylic transport membrane protein
MKLHFSSDFMAGMLFASVGLIAIVIASGYPMGTATRMGAGYFPVIIASVLTLIGALLVVRSFAAEPEETDAIDLRPLVLVLASVVAFGLLIEDWGFPLAGLLLVVGARLAGRDGRPVETAVLAAGLVAGAAFLFVYLLGVNLPHTRFW